MLAQLRPALVMIALFTALTGLAYPLAVTGLAQALVPGRANGSLLVRDGVVIGSSLVGQAFSADRYLQPRPSATSAPDPADPAKSVDAPYNGASSSGSNLGPTNAKLIERVKGDVARLRAQGTAGTLPADLVTASASGLDPDLSPEAARLQVPRIARARSLPEARVAEVVERHVEARALGFLGEPTVNVLAVNLALDALRP